MVHESHEFSGLQVVFASEQLRALMSRVEKVAASQASVLITGETGSGKEVLAQAIHHFSKRKAKSWVDVNCTALPDHLLESELFGYEKGAFSGAISSKPGLFELADKGTLFLDEIGDLDLRLQAKLLRVLDGAPYYRLGGVKKVSVDVRLVTATNQNLKALADAGKFRPDLYHRLSQIHLVAPPLRERNEDIAPLAMHFLHSENPELKISADALEALTEYSWPGNVRELRNVMIRAAVLALGPEITRKDIAEDLPLQPADGLASIHEAERAAIVGALEAACGHQLRAAQRLGISKRTLQRRLKTYGLEANGNFDGGTREEHANPHW
jgi:transcriptional regulator with GAF, ATPase, and Fis domain